LFCPSRGQWRKRNGVAIRRMAESEVSFIEQIGGARTQRLPRSERAVRHWSLPFTFQNDAAKRLNVIWRPDYLRDPRWFPSR
jgi:hypothetical protein